MNSAIFGRVAPFPLILVSVVIFGRKAYTDTNYETKNIFQKMFVGSSLIMLWTIKNALEATNIPLPWFIHSISNGLFQVGLLIICFSVYQTMNDQIYQPLIQINHPATLCTLIASSLMICADYIGRAMYISPTNTLNTVSTPMYNVSYSLYFLACSPPAIICIQVYWQALQRHDDLGFIARYIFCMMAYITGLSIVAIAEINLVLLNMGLSSPGLVTWVQTAGPVVCAFFAAMGTAPHSIYDMMVIPISGVYQARQDKRKDLLSLLHRHMVSITPIMRCESNTIMSRDTDILLEISDMRQVILSHHYPTAYTTPVQEAELLHSLVQRGCIYESAGRQLPNLPVKNILKYNLLVAKRLQDLAASTSDRKE